VKPKPKRAALLNAKAVDTKKLIKKFDNNGKILKMLSKPLSQKAIQLECKVIQPNLSLLNQPQRLTIENGRLQDLLLMGSGACP
jgi:hypothetical protein